MKMRIQQWLVWVIIGFSALSFAGDGERVWEEGILVLADSPVFDGFLFDHNTGILRVYFCSGEIVEYHEVTCAAYQALMNAENRVRWFSDHVHRAFPIRRIASAFRSSRTQTQPHTTEEVGHAVRQPSQSRR